MRGIKEGFTNTLSERLGKKASLLIILTFTTIIVIDSTILRFSTYSDFEFSVSSNVLTFSILYLVYASISIILLNSVKKVVVSTHRLPSSMKYYQITIYCTQILMIGIILTILLQIVSVQKYNINFLHASTILTHFSALTFMIALVLMFVSWLRSRRNIIVILYIISFSLVFFSIVISLIYLEYQFTYQSSRTFSPDRKAYPFFSYLANQFASTLGETLNTTFDIVYLLAFISTWIATVKLLYQYHYKIGRIKYFLLIGIPLVYYIFTFEIYFGNLFSPLILNNPLTFGLTYTVIFSATKQVGALLFSLTFWTASSLVANERVVKSLLISALGIAMLFGSIEITTLQYRLYPPFGLVTEAFMPLGAYLLLVGIFASATSVARDGKLRNEFYKSAMSQSNLLKTIGFTQMEKELMKNFKSLEKRTAKLEASQALQEDYSEENVREIVREVMEELKRNNYGKESL